MPKKSRADGTVGKKTKSGHFLTRRGVLAGLGGAAATGFGGRPAAAATTLRMWTFLDPVKGKSPREVVLKKLIENFEAANPGVKILVEPQDWKVMSEKFYAAHQTGAAPDIPCLLQSRLFGAIKLGALANLDDLFVRNWSNDEKDDIDGPVWRMGATPGAHYQISITTGIYGIMYRVDLFKEAGIEPDSLSTWDKFIAAAQKLVKKDANGNVVRWGYGQTNTGVSPAPPILLNVMLDLQGRIFDKDLRATWSGPAGVRGLQMEVDMIRKYGIMAGDAVNLAGEDVYEQFGAGRLGIIRAGTGRYPQMAAKLGRGNVGYLSTPGFTEGKASPTEILAWLVGVWSGSKNKELAGKFVEYLASREADTLWTTAAGQQPNRKSTIADNLDFFVDPNNSMLVKMYKDTRDNGWIAPYGAGDGGWNEAFCAAFQDVMTNNTDPKAALEKVEAGFNRLTRR